MKTETEGKRVSPKPVVNGGNVDEGTEEETGQKREREKEKKVKVCD